MQMPLEAQSCSILRFGVFEVDVRAGEVRKQGVRIKLQEQPFHVLSVLLRRPGEIVTREELRAQLWQSDTFVDFDNGLNTSINKLREALGDSADSPRFVETLPRRGYRFIAPVNGADGPARGAAIGVSTAARTSSRKMVVAVLVLAAGIAGGLLWHSLFDRFVEVMICLFGSVLAFRLVGADTPRVASAKANLLRVPDVSANSTSHGPRELG
jgi:DNA-binding winged helix-turn-helix (wHTH) protein